MLIANTDIEAKQLINLYDADPGRVEVVHPGVDLSVFRPLDTGRRPRRARAAARTPTSLLFAGRIQPLKAPDVLLRAVAELLDQTPRAALPPGRPDRRRPLRHRPRAPRVAGPAGRPSSALDDVVRFVPPVAAGRARPLVTRPRPLVAVPSYNESFGLVAAEAQAAGTPVIAAAVGGLTTVVARRRTAGCSSTATSRATGPPRCAGSCSRTPTSARASPQGALRAGAAVLLGAHRRAHPRGLRAAPGSLMRESVVMSDPRRHGAARLPDRQRDRVHRGPTASSLRAARGEEAPDRRSASTSATHALGVHAFVCRNPDENHERVYRWLLERNLKMYAVSYAVDRLGDIYLDARLPLSLVDPRGARPAARARCSPTPTARSTPSSSSASPPRSARSGSGATCAASRRRTSRRSAAGWKPSATPEVEQPLACRHGVALLRPAPAPAGRCRCAAVTDADLRARCWRSSPTTSSTTRGTSAFLGHRRRPAIG